MAIRFATQNDSKNLKLGMLARFQSG